MDERTMDEYEVQDSLMALLWGESLDSTMLEGVKARTFENDGVMTHDIGLVLHTADGSEFQITIVQSR